MSDHIYYGDELWLIWHGKKYFLEGWSNDKNLKLYLYEMTDGGQQYSWEGDSKHYSVESFLKAKIFDGKSFWDAEQDIEWTDC